MRVSDRCTGRRESVAPKPVVSTVIETAVKAASTTRPRHGERAVVDRREQDCADAGAAADAVQQPDAERLARRACASARSSSRRRVEVPAPPADEQPDGERDDHEADERLGALLDVPGQVRREEDDRQAEREERQRVPAAPCEAEPRRLASPWSRLPAATSRDRGEVVWVGRMAQAEEHRDAP